MKLLLMTVAEAFASLAKENPGQRLVLTDIGTIWHFNRKTGLWGASVSTLMDGRVIIAEHGENTLAFDTGTLHKLGGILEDTHPGRCEDAPCCGCCLQ